MSDRFDELPETSVPAFQPVETSTPNQNTEGANAYLDAQANKAEGLVPEGTPFRDSAVETTHGLLNVGDQLAAGFKTENAAGGLATSIYDYRNDPLAIFGLGQEDGWVPSEHEKELSEGLTDREADEVLGENSLATAKVRRGRFMQEKQERALLRRSGTDGVLMSVVAGLIDLDAPLALLSGGSYAAAKQAYRAGKVYEGLKGGAKASAAVMALESVNVATHETNDWTNIPAAGFLGFGIGSAIGWRKGISAADDALAKHMQRSVKEGSEEFDANVAEGIAENGNQADSVGAMRNDYQTTKVDDDLVTADQANTIDEANLALSERGITSQMENAWNDSIVVKARESVVGEAIADTTAKTLAGAKKVLSAFRGKSKLADRALAALEKAAEYSPDVSKYLVHDFARLMAGNSATLKLGVADLLESPLGTFRNNRSAANLQDMYERRILGAALEPYNRTYNRWAGDEGVGAFGRIANSQKRKEFDVAVTREMNYRSLNDEIRADINPHVKQAADDLSHAGEEAMSIAQGRAGEKSVLGFENITRKHYTPYNWLPQQVRQVIASGRGSKNDLIELYKKGYASAGLQSADLEIFAKAIVNRQLAKASDMDEGLANLMSADARAKIAETMRAGGTSEEIIERIMKGLSGDVAEKGKIGSAKHRLDIDLDVEHNGLRLIDMIDTNMNRTWSKYGRQIAGRSAMARKGFVDEAAKRDWMDTVEAEQAGVQATKNRQVPGSGDGSGHITREDLEDMFTLFSGGPIAGGVSDNIRRMKQFTNLRILNGLGITQMAETGAIIGATGFSAFMKTAPDVVKGLFSKEGLSKLHKDQLAEIEAFTGIIGKDHIIIRDDLALDMLKADDRVQTAFEQGLDKFLGKGQRIQGYTSLFYKMRQMQQQTAVLAMNKRVAEVINGTETMTKRRWEDLGFRGAEGDQIKALIKKHATYKDGEFQMMNLEDWPEDIAEAYSAGLNRFTHQAVQKVLAGEGHMWMHKGMGAIFSHLLQFPIVAMTKQTGRNMRISDMAAMGVFTYGSITAAMSYSVKQATSGNYDNLNPTDIARGAFQLSNMTGWLGTIGDPVAGLFGLPTINKYGTDGLLNPPVLDTLTKVYETPSKLIDGKFGDAAKVLPIFGNAIGMKNIYDKINVGE